MNKLVPLIAGAVGLFGANAHAADSLVLSGAYADSSPAIVEPGVVENVRMVCNEDGRCWRERGRRVIIERDSDSYGYVPRERYIERRDYYDEPRAGVGFRAPGVSVGVGVDRW